MKRITKEKERMILPAIGILLISVSANISRLVFQSNLALERLFSIGNLILVLVAVIGIVAIAFAVLRGKAGQETCELLKQLLLFAGAYILIQVILALLMGMFSWALHRPFGLPGDEVKRIINIFAMIIQIPIKSGATLLLLDIIFKKNKKFVGLWMKIMAGFVLYSLLQMTLWFLNDGVAFIIIRVVLSSGLTLGLCMLVLYLYNNEQSYTKKVRGI